MNVRLVAGRLFEPRDGAGAPRVAIVDELAASKYWRDRSPIGARITIDGPQPIWREIVGVVRTVHHDALDAPPRGTVYFPIAQRATASAFAVIHAGAASRRGSSASSPRWRSRWPWSAPTA